MPIIISAAAVALLGLVGGYLLPFWWSTVLMAAPVGLLFCAKGRTALWGGFIGGLLLWFVYVFLINWQNDSFLAGRLATLFQLPNAFLMLLITGLLGGLFGLAGAITGYSVKRLFLARRRGVKFQ